jgi:hypothetical protein
VELDKEYVTELEKLVDKFDLESVISALSYICSEKSTHIAETWQDVSLAKEWMRCSIILDSLNRLLEDGRLEA